MITWRLKFKFEFRGHSKSEFILVKIDGPEENGLFWTASGHILESGRSIMTWFSSSNSIISSKWVGFGLIWALSVLEIGLEMSYRINPMMSVLNVLKFKNFKFLVCLNIGCIYIDINILIIDIFFQINIWPAQNKISYERTILIRSYIERK